MAPVKESSLAHEQSNIMEKTSEDADAAVVPAQKVDAEKQDAADSDDEDVDVDE